MKKLSWALWVIYLSLLGVLLPHTAWAFGRFEPPHLQWLGWVGALAFEGAIAALTWRLKGVLENISHRQPAWRRWRRSYLNVYALGLLVSIGVSSAANWAHAVEFGQPLIIFARYRIPPNLYTVIFGGILPLCSLLFARILAETSEAEMDTDPALDAAKSEVRDLRRQLRESELKFGEVEGRAIEAETRFVAAGDLVARLFAEDKRTRILAVREWRPALPQSAIAIITDASASHVSEVLAQNGRENED